MGVEMRGVCKVLARFWNSPSPPADCVLRRIGATWLVARGGKRRQAKEREKFWRAFDALSSSSPPPPPLHYLPPSASRSTPTQFCNLWQRERGGSSANQKARICSSGQPAMPWFSWCQVVMVRGALVLEVVTPVKCQQNTRPGKEKGAKSSFCLPLRWDCQGLYSLVWFTFKICDEMVKWSKVCSLRALIQAAKVFAWMSLVRWRGAFCS